MLTDTTVHSGPVGREWAAFIAACNETPRTGDGAARSAPQAVAAPPSQPAPSPLSVDGGAR